MEPNPLDDLPLDVLLALQEALADPSETGQFRARLRAAEAGFHIECIATPQPAPIPMEEAPDDVDGTELSFDLPC